MNQLKLIRYFYSLFLHFKIIKLVPIFTPVYRLWLSPCCTHVYSSSYFLPRPRDAAPTRGTFTEAWAKEEVSGQSDWRTQGPLGTDRLM